MAKIIVVQSRTQPERIEREQRNFRAAIGGRAQVEFLSALDEKLAWIYPSELLSECNGIIFGGSSDFDFDGGRDEKDPARIISTIILARVKAIVTFALAEDFPLLGVCFGHQIIAEMQGGEISHDKNQTKFGAYEVALTHDGEKDPLFSKFPKTFYAQYAHKDSATKLPTGATLLGQANNCKYSILRYGSRAYTMQFHPEVSEMEWGGPMHDSPEASNIIPLWIEHIVSR